MKRTILAALCAIGLAGAAQASPVSFGALSSDDDGRTDIITDALNNLEWLRWDQDADLTYDQTRDLITTGARAGEGWAIADLGKAQAFTDALLDGLNNGCTASQTYAICANGLRDLPALLGVANRTDNYGLFIAPNAANGIPSRAGTVIAITQASNSRIEKINDIDTIANLDEIVTPSNTYGTPVSWLLYREAAAAPAPVPVPTSLPLLAAGLGGLGYLAARKRKMR